MNACIDEAGRGCVYGPVCASAVLWNDEVTHSLLRDSKRLSAKQRNEMYDFVTDNAIDWSVCYAEAEEVDSLNILHATQLAMHRCLDSLDVCFDEILVDGNFFSSYHGIPYRCIVGGDNVVPGISAASILAKVSRDRRVCEDVLKRPELEQYCIQQNKGYCTKAHCDAIQKIGRTAGHRMTFMLPFEKKYQIYNGKDLQTGS